jgi:hypothetical protein
MRDVPEFSEPGHRCRGHRRAGRLPIVRRRVDDGIPPWVLPGGKFESGESPGAAAARGALEETEPTVADLITAWTVGRTLLSMVIGSGCRADALSAGWAVMWALGSVDGATVEAEPVPMAP